MSYGKLCRTKSFFRHWCKGDEGLSASLCGTTAVNPHYQCVPGIIQRSDWGRRCHMPGFGGTCYIPAPPGIEIIVPSLVCLYHKVGMFHMRRWLLYNPGSGSYYHVYQQNIVYVLRQYTSSPPRGILNTP